MRKTTTTDQARQQSRAVERATGQWFCQSGHHYVKGEKRRWRNRTICSPCKERLQRISKPTGATP